MGLSNFRASPLLGRKRLRTDYSRVCLRPYLECDEYGQREGEVTRALSSAHTFTSFFALLRGMKKDGWMRRSLSLTCGNLCK